MKHLESKLQAECVRWFRYQYPHQLIFAIPNGGQRHVLVAARMKAEGVLAGVPDLFIPIPSGTYAGMFIEMKYGNGKPTESQVNIMQKLRDNNYKVIVCNSFEMFEYEVGHYFGF